MSCSGWQLIFLACHWNAEGHRIGICQVVQHVCSCGSVAVVVDLICPTESRQ
uniref:Secreted protein n=1 Tax=Mesocestoides corti TaxID=53468 RepID=A0A5K3FMY9_MESCO